MEIRRCGRHRDNGFSIRYVDDSACGVELLIGQHVLEGVDRRPEEIRLAGEDLRPLLERPGREDLVQLRNQLHRVDGPRTGIGEAGVGQPLGTADGTTQRGPVPVYVEPDDPESPPVRGGVVVHARVAHRLALPDRDRLAGQQIGVQVEAHGIGALAV